jgi:hypothetical protein
MSSVSITNKGFQGSEKLLKAFKSLKNHEEHFSLWKSQSQKQSLSPKSGGK